MTNLSKLIGLSAVLATLMTLGYIVGSGREPAGDSSPTSEETHPLQQPVAPVAAISSEAPIDPPTQAASAPPIVASMVEANLSRMRKVFSGRNSYADIHKLRDGRQLGDYAIAEELKKVCQFAVARASEFRNIKINKENPYVYGDPGPFFPPVGQDQSADARRMQSMDLLHAQCKPVGEDLRLLKPHVDDAWGKKYREATALIRKKDPAAYETGLAMLAEQGVLPTGLSAMMRASNVTGWYKGQRFGGLPNETAFDDALRIGAVLAVYGAESQIDGLQLESACMLVANCRDSDMARLLAVAEIFRPGPNVQQQITLGRAMAESFRANRYQDFLQPPNTKPN